MAGQSLDNSIRGFRQTGPALIIGLLITFYGARGGLTPSGTPSAIFARPQTRPQWLSAQPNPLWLHNCGRWRRLLLASALAGWAGAVGTGILFRSLSVLLNIAMLYLVFMLVFALSLPRRFKRAPVPDRCANLCRWPDGSAVRWRGPVCSTPPKGITTGYSAIFATTLIMLAWILFAG